MHLPPRIAAPVSMRFSSRLLASGLLLLFGLASSLAVPDQAVGEQAAPDQAAAGQAAPEQDAGRPTPSAKPPAGSPTAPKGDGDSRESDRDKPSPGAALRGCLLDSISVIDEAGEELAAVEDFVIDFRAGRIRYVAISYGGLFGVGDKLFAIPYGAFDRWHDLGQKAPQLVLNLNEELLKKAPGFNKDSWPDFADAKFKAAIRDHYKRRGSRQRKASESPRKAPAAKPAPADGTAEAPLSSTEKPSEDVVHRAEKLCGMVVLNASGEKLGVVADYVFDSHTGRVRYAALSFGGFKGLNDKLFAVPWSALDLQFDKATRKHFLVLPLERSVLEQMQGFREDDWPEFADGRFRKLTR